MDILILVVSGVLVWLHGIGLGWKMRERHATKQIDSFMKQVDEQVEEKISNSMIRINIEKHNDTFYVYNKDNNDFMGQGTSKQELEKILSERFPNKKFMADSDNLKEMGL